MQEESPLLAESSASGNMASQQTLQVLVAGTSRQLTLDDTCLSVPEDSPSSGVPSFLSSCGPRIKSSSKKIPLKHILGAKYLTEKAEVTITAVGANRLVQMSRVTVSESSQEQATAFVEAVVKLAYPGHAAPHRRRLKVLINPAGGQGKARHVWTQSEKILQAAGCPIDLEATTHARHAMDIGKTIDPSLYDAVVCVSGDGLPYEFLNGVKARSDAADVLRRLPIAQIGAGTSNALACNLTGPDHCDDYVEACLSIIKGQPTPIPLCKLQQDKLNSYSFLSQAMGLIADCDVGSDAYRWAGRNRVYVAYVACVIAGRSYPCSVELKVVETGASNIKESFAARDDKQSAQQLLMDRTSEGTWQTLPLDRLTCFYAGTLPWTDPGMLAFPTARGDGLIDIIISETNSRKDLLTLMDGTEVGKFIDHPSVSHYRVSTYRLTPKRDDKSKPSDLLVIDGERLEYAPIEVSVDGCFFGLSMHGQDRYLPKSHWN